jgi:hypothetical protein
VDLLVSRHVTPPMIVVAPDVNAGWLRDSECLDEVGGAQVATYLVNASSGAVRRVQRLAGLFARRGIPTQFRIQRGQGHTWAEARVGLPWGLLFAARHLAAS